MNFIAFSLKSFKKIAFVQQQIEERELVLKGEQKSLNDVKEQVILAALYLEIQ